jgi:hypothetical protein
MSEEVPIHKYSAVVYVSKNSPIVVEFQRYSTDILELERTAREGVVLHSEVHITRKK